MSWNTQRRANTAQKRRHLKKKTTSYPSFAARLRWKKFTQALNHSAKGAVWRTFIIASNFNEAQMNSTSTCGTHTGAYSPHKLEWSGHEYFKSQRENPSSSRPLSGDGWVVFSLQHHHTQCHLKLPCHIKSMHWQTLCLLRTYHLWTRALVHTMMSKQTQFLLCLFGLFITIQVECAMGHREPLLILSTRRTGLLWLCRTLTLQHEPGRQWLRQWISQPGALSTLGQHIFSCYI